MTQVLDELGRFQFTTFIDGVNLHTIENDNPIIFHDVTVYTSHPYFSPAPVEIKNLEITTEPVLYRGLVWKTFEKYYPWWRVSFGVRRNNAAVSKFENILLVRKRTKASWDEPGGRMPGIFLQPNSLLSISVFLNGEVTIVKVDLPVGVWINIAVSQTPVNYAIYNFTIEINGVIFYEDVNENPEIFDNVDVYTTDSEFPVANVNLRNLNVLSKPFSTNIVPNNGHVWKIYDIYYPTWRQSLNCKFKKSLNRNVDRAKNQNFTHKSKYESLNRNFCQNFYFEN